MSGKKKKKNKIRISRPAWYAILLIWIVTLLAALFFVGRWGLNAYYVNEARNGKYHPEIAELLIKLGLPDEYIVWYNLGNYYFDEEEYDEAKDAYLKAIECDIPYGKECPVKVNLALAMLSEITEDEWDMFYLSCSLNMTNATARKVEKILKEAREVLIADGCAHEDDEDGHDEAAQKLKDEIDELLEMAEQMEEQEPAEEEPEEEEEPEDDGGEDVQEVTPDETLDEEDIMEHIQEQLDENQGERADDRQFYEDYYGFGNDGENSGGEHGEVW